MELIVCQLCLTSDWFTTLTISLRYNILLGICTADLLVID